jgi:drug/metabolite transporter (DMT)-like permease
MMSVIYVQPILAVLIGVLILAMPHLLNYLVATFLIVFGVLGMLPLLS